VINSFEKRLEQLGRTVGKRRERTIVIKVPTALTPIESSVECDAVVTKEPEQKLMRSWKLSAQPMRTP
jgi:hypothetical protein